MNFLYWLYVVICLWFAQRRGQRVMSTAEYARVVSDAETSSQGMPASRLPQSQL